VISPAAAAVAVNADVTDDVIDDVIARTKLHLTTLFA